MSQCAYHMGISALDLECPVCHEESLAASEKRAEEILRDYLKERRAREEAEAKLEKAEASREALKYALECGFGQGELKWLEDRVKALTGALERILEANAERSPTSPMDGYQANVMAKIATAALLASPLSHDTGVTCNKDNSNVRESPAQPIEPATNFVQVHDDYCQVGKGGCNCVLRGPMDSITKSEEVKPGGQGPVCKCESGPGFLIRSKCPIHRIENRESQGPVTKPREWLVWIMKGGNDIRSHIEIMKGEAVMGTTWVREFNPKTEVNGEAGTAGPPDLGPPYKISREDFSCTCDMPGWLCHRHLDGPQAGPPDALDLLTQALTKISGSQTTQLRMDIEELLKSNGRL